MNTHPNNAHSDGPQQGLETRDANWSLVIWSTVGILVSVALCMVIAALQFRFEQSMLPQPEPGSVFTQEGKVPPGPRLQPFPSKDLVEFRTKESSRTASYGWVDKEGGIAHVPVDKAIDMVLKTGLPSRGDASAAAPAKPVPPPAKKN